MSLSPDSIQQIITEALVSSRDLSQLPNTFLTDIMSDTESAAEAIKLAAETVYKRFYYSFVVDLHLDGDEEQRGCELQRLLRIDDGRATEEGSGESTMQNFRLQLVSRLHKLGMWPAKQTIAVSLTRHGVL